jgi:hypothetical protein
MSWLTEIIDKSFAKMVEEEYLMQTCVKIPLEMCLEDYDPRKEYKTWNPIPSIVTDESLNKLEEKLKLNLPKSYREFLKYKHFVELQIDDFAVSFPKHLPNTYLETLEDFMLNIYEPKYLINKKLICFASFHDEGYLCFDATESKQENEYKIIYLDHENIDDKIEYCTSFKELMEGDKERSNIFITTKLNKRYQN